jgi:tRNA uracil 4-sulfurtransferase
MYTHIIINYDEIILKGGNRPFFERALVDNIKEFLREISYSKISKEGGRLIIKIDEKTEVSKIGGILKNIPGISNFSFAIIEENDIEKICKKTLQLLNENKEIKECKTFKVSARRSNKRFDMKSPEINIKAGEYIFERTKLKVDVHNPDLEIIINVGDEGTFIYFEKIKGVGGLPVGTTGNLISLISGGIDSPVASFMMNKRGAKNVFVHFKNKIISGSADGQDKIKILVKELCKFQGRSKLYVVPFEEFQKEIIAKISSKNRMIVYRRIMFRLAGMIAKKENAKGFVTGDSLSQVASQTIDNITAIYNAANLPIFPPLIGMNKQEIVDIASIIGTYEISILPYQDCCSFLISKHPETKAKLEEIINQEKNLEIEKIAKEVLAKVRPKIIGL